MDDALVPAKAEYENWQKAVLILVVMDDALVLVRFRHKRTYVIAGLNPCCNG